MKRAFAILFAVCLTIGLAGCENSQPAASQEPVCEHKWADATFAAPQTCTKCGETQGEPVPDYFTANGLSVLEEPPAESLPMKYITFQADDPTALTAWDNGRFTVEQKIAPADKHGYKLVIVTFTMDLPIVNDKSTQNEFNFRGEGDFYDYYTGQRIPQRYTVGDDAYGYGVELTYDGVTYDVAYSEEIVWASSDWYTDENGVYRNDFQGKDTYTFCVPEDYDGLVYALIPCIAYEEWDTEDIDKEVTYPLDLAEDGKLDDTVFIRLGTSK